MSYEVVQDYSRREQFEFFRKYRDPRYALTIELDITALKPWTRARDYSLYANMCYFCTRAMNELDDFRLRILDGDIVRHEKINLSLVVPADDGGFSFTYLDYDPDIAVFNEAAAFAMNGPRGPSDLTDEGRQDQIFYSALPDIAFTSLTHISEDDPEHAVPKITFGKYLERHGRLLVPVGIQVNHIFIDGKHLGEFTGRVSTYFGDPDSV